MCCCGKPVINGEMGYKWQPDNAPSIRPIDAPALGEGDVILFDEPGRCGGTDCHSHHFRVIENRGWLFLLVRHGGGDERISISRMLRLAIATATEGRYWLLHGIYSTQRDAETRGQQKEYRRWSEAAIEKRIRVRKVRGHSRLFNVKILDRQANEIRGEVQP